MRKELIGYIIEQFPHTRKMSPTSFKVFWTKKKAKEEIMGLNRDSRPEIYKVKILIDKE